MRKILLFLPLLFTLTGCASLNNLAAGAVEGDVVTKLKFGADVVLLDKEFEDAYESLIINDFNDIELQNIEFHLAHLQDLKLQVEKLSAGGVELAGAVIAVADSRQFLDQIAFHYNAIKGTYIGYLSRNQLQLDPVLGSYNQSAISVWRSLDSIVNDDNQGVNAGAMRGLISYVARGYILYKTGGAIGRSPISLPEPAPPAPRNGSAGFI